MVRFHTGCLSTGTSWRALLFRLVMSPSPSNHHLPSLPSSQSTYRVASHCTSRTEHLHRSMRKPFFDEGMLEQVRALVFMPKVDAIIFDRRAEAVGGRRDGREVTSPRCHIGISEACSMPHSHTCRSAGAAAGSVSGCMCMLHAPHEAASTMARCAGALGREFALVFACLCERV